MSKKIVKVAHIDNVNKKYLMDYWSYLFPEEYVKSVFIEEEMEEKFVEKKEFEKIESRFDILDL